MGDADPAMHPGSSPKPELTVLEVLRRAAAYLETHGSGSARLDAEVLLAHSLGKRRLDLYLEFDRRLTERELQPYRDLTARRGKGEPVAYLTGRKEFMGLELEVTPAVLVPNPDTEVLVQRAVAWLRDRGGELTAADVGTGSGCVAVAVAHYAPGVTVFASDLSPEALAVAGRNLARHGLQERVRLLEGDLLDPLPAGLDLICANLPYVARDTQLAPDVMAQPAMALYAGPRGGELVIRLLEQAPAKLRPGGAVLAEVDPLIAEQVEAVAAGLYPGCRLHRDLQGMDRLLEAWIS